MSRKKIVAGNWKMNTNWTEAFDLATAIKDNSSHIQGVEKILFPPFPFMQMLRIILNEGHGFFVGAQNCSEHPKGAFTGEVSAQMIQSTGCDYVIVGHSERRAYFKETSDQLISKIGQALAHNLKVIFCFGENLAERKNDMYFEAVKKQLRDVLETYPADKTDQLVLAYEPVWAIGTGETATPLQAQEIHAYVRTLMVDLFSREAADELCILYGGSCNAQNAKELFACKDVDGGLIGGASLKSDEFCKIISSFE